MHRLTAKELKAARKILGFTQEELAEAVDVAANTVGKWECAASPCEGPAAVLIRKLVAEKRSAAKNTRAAMHAEYEAKKAAERDAQVPEVKKKRRR